MKPGQLILALMFLVLLFAFWGSLTEHRAEQPTGCEYPVDEAAATYIVGANALLRSGGSELKPLLGEGD